MMSLLARILIYAQTVSLLYVCSGRRSGALESRTANAEDDGDHPFAAAAPPPVHHEFRVVGALTNKVIVTLPYGQPIKDVREAVRRQLRLPRRAAKVKLLLPDGRELGSADWPWETDDEVLTPAPSLSAPSDGRGRMRRHDLPPSESDGPQNWPGSGTAGYLNARMSELEKIRHELSDSYFYPAPILPPGRDLRAVVQLRGLVEGENPAAFAAEALFDEGLPLVDEITEERAMNNLPVEGVRFFGGGADVMRQVRPREAEHGVAVHEHGNGYRSGYYGCRYRIKVRLEQSSPAGSEQEDEEARRNPKTWSVTVADRRRSWHPVFTQLERFLYLRSSGHEDEMLPGFLQSTSSFGAGVASTVRRLPVDGQPTNLEQLFARLPAALPLAGASTGHDRSTDGGERFFDINALVAAAEMGEHTLLAILADAAEGDTFLLRWLGASEEPSGVSDNSIGVWQEYVLSRTRNGVDVIEMVSASQFRSKHYSSKTWPLNCNDRLDIAYKVDFCSLSARVEGRARIVLDRPWQTPREVIPVSQEILTGERDEKLSINEPYGPYPLAVPGDDSDLETDDDEPQRVVEPFGSYGGWYDGWLGPIRNHKIIGARLLGPRRGWTAADGRADVGPVPEMLEDVAKTFFGSVTVVAVGAGA